MQFILKQESEMIALGSRLAKLLNPPTLIFLYGELGVGKTTFTRGILRALGYAGVVKSPTYTLVETYHFASITCYHFDFYRVVDPHELEYMGIRDYLSDNAICLVEWPERANGVLIQPDLCFYFEYQGEQRSLVMKAESEKGMLIIENMKDSTRK